MLMILLDIAAPRMDTLLNGIAHLGLSPMIRIIMGTTKPPPPTPPPAATNKPMKMSKKPSISW